MVRRTVFFLKSIVILSNAAILWYACLQSGLISAYIVKTIYFGMHSTDRERGIMILMAYLSYSLAELSGLSGILSVFCSGIVTSHCTVGVTLNFNLEFWYSFSFVLEALLFLSVGMDALDIAKWKSTQSSFKKSMG